MTDYRESAQDFLTKTNTKLEITFLKRGFYFLDDKEPRDIYKFTIRRNGKQYSGTFGNSIHNTRNNIIPDCYDILYSLSLSCYEEFENVLDFSKYFGYEIWDKESWDSVNKIYKAWIREKKGVNRLFHDVLNELSKI